MASQGIALSDSEFAESYGESAHGSSSSQISAANELPPSPMSGQSITTLTRLKQKMDRFWLHVVQRWPTVY